MALTSTSYIGAALVELFSRPVESIQNKDFRVVEQDVPNQEIFGLLAKANGGKQPSIETVDDASLQAALKSDNPFVALAAGLKRKIAEGWPWSGQETVEVKGWTPKPLDNYFRA